jgi:subtilase family serine protease
MAPGATILAAAAQNCEDGLNDMLEKIVDQHLASIVSNSYGDTGGDLFDTASDRQATDQILQMAAGTGVTVMYSAGDDGDDYIDEGVATPDYPASSPYATAVGGTSLAVGSTNQRLAEYGWSTGISDFCNVDLAEAQGCAASAEGTWGPLSYDYGGGGGTSYQYNQPAYQKGIVPTAVADAHGTTPMRAIPDVSMDADPSTGMLVGETQTFPDGTYYDQYRIGGTSLASPLLAGVVARADGKSGTSAGFLNPALYAMAGNATDLNDITSPKTPQDVVRSDYIDGVDSSSGIDYSARSLDDQGSETYCSDANNCTSHAITLSTTSGYDNMTGLGTPGTGFVSTLAH